MMMMMIHRECELINDMPNDVINVQHEPVQRDEKKTKSVDVDVD